MDKLELYYNYMIDILEIDQKIIDCVISINGYNLETLENILYFFTGYRYFNQLKDFEEEED